MTAPLFDGPPVGFSGPRRFSEEQRLVALTFYRAALLELRPREATSGCAIGADTLGIELAEEIGVPLLRLTIPIARGARDLYVPTINSDLLDRAQGDESGRWVVEHGKPGRTPGDAFLKRDDLTVARSEVLLVTPKTATEEMRGSGTWATLRRGQIAGIEVRCMPLNGDPYWVIDADGSRLF